MLTETDAGWERDTSGGVPLSEPTGEVGWCAWVVGDCWLWCRRTETAVTWLGPVISWGTHAPLYACEECISRLEEQVRASPAGEDGVCWLWCGRGDVPLTRLAEVEYEGVTAVFSACDECIGRVKQRVLDLAMDKDTSKH